MASLVDAWYAKNPACYLLTPLSALYRSVVTTRRAHYAKRSLTQFPVPIIVVGNITIGGTGKTPLVIALAELLKQQGLQPGIVSRGYGGHAEKYPLSVDADTDPKLAGDEPVLIAKRTGCPLVVAPDRVAAVQQLLAEHDCQVVLSDDGLQHYNLARDIEIAVIDGARRFGNGFCLPAGPLREPLSRLRSVDFIVSNGPAENNEFSMTLTGDVCQQIINREQHKPLKEFTKVHAIAGIGNPQRFFNKLREQDLEIIEHPLSDHHNFTQQDITFKDDFPVIMTEKDAVKCQNIATSQHWCLPITAELPDSFSQKLLQCYKKCRLG